MDNSAKHIFAALVGAIFAVGIVGLINLHKDKPHPTPSPSPTVSVPGPEPSESRISWEYGDEG